MSKTELIKNALHKEVEVIAFDNDVYTGYLVEDLDKKGCYEILPTRGDTNNHLVVRVSHIKHIKYTSNGYQLW